MSRNSVPKGCAVLFRARCAARGMSPRDDTRLHGAGSSSSAVSTSSLVFSSFLRLPKALWPESRGSLGLAVWQAAYYCMRGHRGKRATGVGCSLHFPGTTAPLLQSKAPFPQSFRCPWAGRDWSVREWRKEKGNKKMGELLHSLSVHFELQLEGFSRVLSVPASLRLRGHWEIER